MVRALLRTVRGTVRGLPHLSGVRSGVSIVGFQGVPGCRGIFVEIDIEGSARGGVLRIQSHNTAGPATLLTKTPGAGERLDAVILSRLFPGRPGFLSLNSYEGSARGAA